MSAIVCEHPDFEARNKAAAEASRQARAFYQMQLQQLYLTEPPAPRIYLTQSGLFGGFCDQTSGAEMLVYESIVENSGRVYCWVYRPHQRACINGMSIEEQAQFWHEAYAMPRAWFDAVMQTLANANLVRIEGDTSQTTDFTKTFRRIDSQFNADGSINYAHPVVKEALETVREDAAQRELQKAEQELLLAKKKVGLMRCKHV